MVKNMGTTSRLIISMGMGNEKDGLVLTEERQGDS